MDSIEKVILSALVALISWFIKDLLVGLNMKRNESLRHEWEYRLKQVWSPLFYWSGVVLFRDEQKGWAKHGLSDLETTLARSAHLLPREHFYTFIKLLEMTTEQKTTRLTVERIQRAREYVYNQIKVLNYLLYRESGLDDVSWKTNLLHPYAHLLRLVSLGIIHLGIWIAIAGMILGVYSLYSKGYYWPIALVVVGLSLIVLVDMRKRREINREIKKRRS